MSTEQMEPLPGYGDDGHSAPTPQTVSEEGSPAAASGGGAGRRRRRRRKNRSQGAGQQAGGSQPAAQPAAAEEGVASAAAPAPQPQSGHQPQGSGGKRKKRNRGGTGGGPQPGNQSSQNGGNGQQWQHQRRGSWRRNPDGPDGNREGARGGFGSEHFQDVNGNSNGRRKGKFGQRGPRSFVGPMDHSYRAVNGNVADGPPSTMDFRNANGNIHGRNDVSASEPAMAVRDDAPTRIVCFIEDLFIVTKMNETARKLGVKVQFAKAEKDTLSAIMDAPDESRPALIVFDLNNANAKPLTVIPKLKAKLKRGTSIIGFLQHIQGDLKMKAVEAGCDTVMPRSAFSLSLPNLLRRYGFDEEEEMLGA